MIKIAIAEEHTLIREGFKRLLANAPNLSVIGEASDGLRAIEIVEQLKPDLLLLELDLPRVHGIEVIRRVRTCASKTHTIVVSIHSQSPQVSEALRAGTGGYLLKNDSFEDLTQAIKVVMTGDYFISPRLRKTALSAALGVARQSDDPFLDLTQRERAVLQHAANGLCNRDIGAKLFISSRTVESHRANLMKKLSLTNQTDLVRYAIRRKIISP